MVRLFFALYLMALVASPARADCPEALDFKLRALNENRVVDLCKEYTGKVVLVVNTASYCGFTKQYEGLEALHERYKGRGFVVLGFPSNDYGAQEPGKEEEIASFCRLTYGVRFPMFEKIHAAEGVASPLYRTLARQAGEYPRWNFHKYLLDRTGEVAGSFDSVVTPESGKLVRAIEALL